MPRFPSPSLVVSMVALVVALGGAGYSATGGNFILGQANSASTQTKLVAPFAGAALLVNNLSTSTSASGLSIETDAGRPPLVVTSTVKVSNLNADLLDGLDSTKFVRGSGVAKGRAVTIAPAHSAKIVSPTAKGFISLEYGCPALLGSNGTLTVWNDSTAVANLFVDSGTDNPTYTQLAAGSTVAYPALAAGDTFSIQAQGASGVASIQVATVHRNANNICYLQTLFVVAS